jgi:hypothetical protein
MSYCTLNLKVISKNSVHNFLSKGTFFSFVSLLFMFVLISSLVVSIFGGVSFFVSGAESVQVGTEGALRDAVNSAVEPAVIALTADITLTDSTLTILEGKDITLVSNNNVKFFKLIGSNEQSTILVENGGVLQLDGIIVTHSAGSSGIGVVVKSGGSLVLSNGEISGNYGAEISSGVYNHGSFVMLGGVIANNTAARSGGRGIYNMGHFVMSGGVIANNTAVIGSGGGVHVWYGSFQMSGGVISGNTAMHGGGVAVYVGSFEMFDGVIVNNTARGTTLDGVTNSGVGGGVYARDLFSMSGGKITNNSATSGGGVYMASGFFSMSGDAVVANNTGYYCMYLGLGVSFVMSGGTIADNNGGGVFMSSWSSFELSDGTISGNAVSYGGGGVYVESGCSFVMSGGTICNNTAGSVVYGGGFGGGVFVAQGGSFCDVIWYNF